MNEQEAFWVGAQGDLYIERNGAVDVASRVSFWNRVFAWDEPGAPRSVIEFGANIGLNLQAIRAIHSALEITQPDLWAVEINARACDQLRAAHIGCSQMSMLDCYRAGSVPALADARDLAFTMGVLIHVAAEDLHKAYSVLAAASRRYVLMAEYYCPTPREIAYRGERNRCWARDFAGEFLDYHEGKFSLVDYGFVYRRDPHAPLDDITWFLMERTGK